MRTGLENKENKENNEYDDQYDDDKHEDGHGQDENHTDVIVVTEMRPVYDANDSNLGKLRDGIKLRPGEAQHAASRISELCKLSLPNALAVCSTEGMIAALIWGISQGKPNVEHHCIKAFANLFEYNSKDILDLVLQHDPEISKLFQNAILNGRNEMIRYQGDRAYRTLSNQYKKNNKNNNKNSIALPSTSQRPVEAREINNGDPSTVEDVPFTLDLNALAKEVTNGIFRKLSEELVRCNEDSSLLLQIINTPGVLDGLVRGFVSSDVNVQVQAASIVSDLCQVRHNAGGVDCCSIMQQNDSLMEGLVHCLGKGQSLEARRKVAKALVSLTLGSKEGVRAVIKVPESLKTLVKCMRDHSVEEYISVDAAFIVSNIAKYCPDSLVDEPCVLPELATALSYFSLQEQACMAIEHIASNSEMCAEAVLHTNGLIHALVSCLTPGIMSEVVNKVSAHIFIALAKLSKASLRSPEILAALGELASNTNNIRSSNEAIRIEAVRILEGLGNQVHVLQSSSPLLSSKRARR